MLAIGCKVMQENNQGVILAACRFFLRPLARLLIKYGIGYREFSVACKAAFVDAASSQYGLRGRPANLSRVAVLTGLSRKEVRKIRLQDKLKEDSLAGHGLNPASMVLRGWYSDPQFLSPNGTPLPLALKGRTPNLLSLVKKYAGDVPAGAVISEMRRVGLVEEYSAGRIRPIGTAFILPNLDGQLFASGATSIHNLISTIAHNVSAERREDRYFERYAWSSYLPRYMIAKFHSLVSSKGSEFLEFFDLWLKKHEQKTSLQRGSVGRSEIGVGVYFFGGPSHSGAIKPIRKK